MSADTKAYLGDGVYADVEWGALVLTTEDGIRTTNRIVLEPEVFREVLRFVERVKARNTADDTGDVVRYER